MIRPFSDSPHPHAGDALLFLGAADHRTMAWKNGRGTTTEIAVFPPQASLANFEWRISTATVSADGMFSAFPGVDRTLVILEGDGLRLSVSGADQVEISQTAQPLFFPADAPTHASLTGRTVIDLNVMTRRDLWRHTVRRLRNNPLPTPRDRPPDVSIWYCVTGSARLATSTSRLPAKLRRHDALISWSSAAQSVSVSPAPNADLLLIELDLNAERDLLNRE